MFTPPPSPRKPIIPTSHAELEIQIEVDSCTSKNASQHQPLSPLAAKRSIGRRIKWAAILVPVALILGTLSYHYISHPHALDLISTNLSPASRWRNWSCTSDRSAHIPDKAPHIRHRRQSSLSSSLSLPGTPTTNVPSSSSSGAAQSLPTIPSAPPVLPTPFPRAFDTSFTRNFSSTDCYSFFLNMTSATSFLACRPFSLLLQSSQAFIQQAQTNITLLNDVIWGTCNPTISISDCTTDMAGYASTIESTCKADLDQQNAVVVSTLQALKAFPLMANTGCLPDISTNTYCFVKAVWNANPSDQYFYQLPLGTQLPNNTFPSCSACTKTMLSLYAQALGNETKGTLPGLENTYSAAAKLAVSKCGTGYAATQVANAKSGAVRFGSGMVPVLALTMAIGLTLLSGLP